MSTLKEGQARVRELESQKWNSSSGLKLSCRLLLHLMSNLILRTFLEVVAKSNWRKTQKLTSCSASHVSWNQFRNGKLVFHTCQSFKTVMADLYFGVVETLAVLRSLARTCSLTATTPWAFFDTHLSQPCSWWKSHSNTVHSKRGS